MRRILIFSLVYYPKYVGGAEVAVKEITDRISTDEMHFEMITLNGGGEAATDTYGNIIVHRIMGGVGIIQKLLYPFAAYAKAKKLHQSAPYDAVWSIMASYAGFASFLFKRTFPSIPHLLTVQEGDHFERRAGILNPLFKWIFRSADRIQVISEFLADWSIEMGATCPITVVPNAVDVESFSKPISLERADILKTELGKKTGDVFLITTSRLVEKNGVGDIIDSLAHLSRNVKLLILGTGGLENSLRKKALVIDETGQRVKFLGFVAHAQMPDYLKVSDIFIRPSLTEGLGNSFLEAMAAGIAVIATPVGGIPDFLTDGETGLFCEVKNPRSIAQKVEKLMKDPESRDYIIKRAGQMVRERYGWERIAGMMKAEFDNL